MTEEFRMVTRKKWLARKGLQRRTRRISDRDGPEVDVDMFLKRLEKVCQQMTTSDYFTLSLQTLARSLALVTGNEKPKRMVCFGLGPFTRNFQALHQFAFILSLQRKYDLTDNVYYDPVFNETEKEVLQRLDCDVMSENCEAKYEAVEPTLFYLPHCPNGLANNLLWRNWGRDKLPNAILINNSFESLTTNTPERILSDEAGYIRSMLKYTKEFPLEDDYDTPNVFNDLSVHVFPEDLLPDRDSEFWEKREAPIYSDSSAEMIFANDFDKLNIT